MQLSPLTNAVKMSCLVLCVLQAFDVIAFAAGAHSWSLAHTRRQRAIADGSKRYSGRAVRSTSSLCVASGRAGIQKLHLLRYKHGQRQA